MSLLKFSLSPFVKILHSLRLTDSARPPCVLWLFPWSNVHLSVLLWIGQLSFFFYWLLDILRAGSDYNNNIILCHLPDAACINSYLPQSTASSLSRAQCIPQHGGSCSQQHPVGSGLHQTTYPAAVCALLPPSSPLWPQCRTTPEERHSAAGWVSHQVKQGLARIPLLLRLSCWKRKGEGSGKYAAVVYALNTVKLSKSFTHAHTHAHSVVVFSVYGFPLCRF